MHVIFIWDGDALRVCHYTFYITSHVVCCIAPPHCIQAESFGVNNAQQVALTLVSRYSQRLRSIIITHRRDLCLPYDYVYPDYDYLGDGNQPLHPKVAQWHTQLHLQVTIEKILTMNHMTLEHVHIPIPFGFRANPFGDSNLWMTILTVCSIEIIAY
jgi:hypothetical protein